MSNFKVGDRVRLNKSTNNYTGTYKSDNGYIKVIGSWGDAIYDIWSEDSNNYYGLFSEKEVRPYNSITTTNTKLMSSVKSFIKKVSRKQPEKAFVEAGFIDENEDITEKGREALELVLWDANKEAIKKIADQIIAAEEKK